MLVMIGVGGDVIRDDRRYVRADSEWPHLTCSTAQLWMGLLLHVVAML